MFLWQGDVRLVPAIVKYLEDRQNVAHDAGELGVQAILVIEDNVRYYSSFLPTMYAELMHHAHNLVPEGVNLSHKLMRLQAQPKILLCTSYEEAWAYFDAYETNILGVISDVEFPREGRIVRDAGLEFARRVRERQPDVPVMLQSTRAENQWQAREAGASFLLKGSSTLLQQLRRFMVDQLGFGDFVFRHARWAGSGARARSSGARGPAGHRAGRKPRLPRRAQSFLQLVQGADGIRARRSASAAQSVGLRDGRRSARGTAARDPRVPARHEPRRRRDFDRATRDPETTFSRVGGGSLGGKARGLAFVDVLLSQSGLAERFPRVRITVPQAVVLATDLFDEFLEQNSLRDFALETTDEQELERRFVSADLPAAAERDLASFAAATSYPARGSIVEPARGLAVPAVRGHLRHLHAAPTITIGQTSGCGSC